MLLLLSINAFARDDKSTPPPPFWKLCWQLPNVDLTSVQPISQNERLFLASPGGKLSAIDSTTGETLWRTELGGEIIGQITVNKNLVYAASLIAANKQQTALIVVRALSIETGLTVWQGELASASQFSLALQGTYLLAASGDLNSAGKIIALSADKGDFLWTQTAAAPLSTSLALADNTVIFATADKILHILNLLDGREIRRFTLPAPAYEKIVLTKGLLFFGDKSGTVSALAQTDGKILWKLRLGGAAQNILITENAVLISSLDDFVYFQSIPSGKRIWRKRLASRPLGAVLLGSQNALIIATSENSLTVLDLKKGNVLSQMFLGEENVAVAAPFATQNFVFVPTAQGLLAFSPVSIVCPAK